MKKFFHQPYIEIVRIESSESIQGTCVLECLCDIDACNCVGNCVLVLQPSGPN